MEAAEFDQQQDHDGDEGVDRRLLVTVLHVLGSFVHLQRIARRLAVHTPHVEDETIAGRRVPYVALGIDLQQVVAVMAHEPLHEAGRQVVQRGRLGTGDAPQHLQPLQQLLGDVLLVVGKSLIEVARWNLPQQFGNSRQRPGPRGLLPAGPFGKLPDHRCQLPQLLR